MDTKFDDVLIHHGVKGMKWGVRKRQEKAAKYKKASSEAAKRGKTNKAERLHKKSRSYVQGSPEYNDRLKRNIKLTVASILAARVTLQVASAALNDPGTQAKILDVITKVEKTRLKHVLRNDFRFTQSDSNAITKGLDLINASRGAYNITKLK